jgi:hypothetical protein
MLTGSFVSKLFGRKTSKTTARSAPRGRTHLGLETLEGRCLPSTLSVGVAPRPEPILQAALVAQPAMQQSLVAAPVHIIVPLVAGAQPSLLS